MFTIDHNLQFYKSVDFHQKGDADNYFTDTEIPEPDSPIYATDKTKIK